MTYERSHSPLPPGSVYRWSLVFAILLLSGVLVWRSAYLAGDGLHDPNAAPRSITQRGALFPAEEARIGVFKSVAPSVVFITRFRERRVFGGTTEIRDGTGSGFIWDDQGHIVTNYHVVANSDRLKVML